jgi:cytochrome c oxidase subunit 2
VKPTRATAQRGLKAFLASKCASCHAIRGTNADATAGPDLTHFASRSTLGAGVLPNTLANLADWVANPHAIKDGVEMPAAELTDKQLAAVLVYLDSLE